LSAKLAELQQALVVLNQQIAKLETVIKDMQVKHGVLVIPLSQNKQISL